MSAALQAHVVVSRREGFRLDVRLDAAPGEIVGIMGPSGAGKSTLLNALAGLERLTDGLVRIDDDTVAARGRHVRPEARGVALLGQNPRLFPHLSARENIAFGPRAQGVARDLARGAADEWMWRVGLDGSGDRRPAQLSGGQQQRVAIARALAAGPRLLLLDEPLTSLDAETASEIRGVLQTQLAATKTTTAFVTHDVVDAVAMASHLAIIEGGALMQVDSVRAVLAAPASRFAAAVAGLNRIEGVADRGGWRAIGVAPEVLLGGTDAAAPATATAPALALALALATATALADGTPTAAVFRPDAVRLSRPAEMSWTAAVRIAESAPSERGTWVARVTRLEQTLGGVRVHTADPVVAVDLPADEIAQLRLSPGTPVQLRVDPADVRFHRLGKAG